jgi:hypothetical protein
MFSGDETVLVIQQEENAFAASVRMIGNYSENFDAGVYDQLQRQPLRRKFPRSFVQWGSLKV